MSTVEDCETAILTHLSSSPDAVIEDSYPFSQSSNFDHTKVVGAIKSLLADEYVTSEDIQTQFYSLANDEATSILQDGAQEIRVLKALNASPEGKLSLPDLQAAVVDKTIAKIGMGNCMKNKWIKKDGDGKLIALKKDEEVSDDVQAALKTLQEKDFAVDALDDKVCRKISWVLVFENGILQLTCPIFLFFIRFCKA